MPGTCLFVCLLQPTLSSLPLHTFIFIMKLITRVVGKFQNKTTLLVVHRTVEWSSGRERSGRNGTEQNSLPRAPTTIIPGYYYITPDFPIHGPP